VRRGGGRALGVELCSATWCAARGRRREKEGRKKEEEEKKRKRIRKIKIKRRRKGERGKEREMRWRSRRRPRDRSSTRGGRSTRSGFDGKQHTQNKKEHRDWTDDWYWCQDGSSPGKISGYWEFGRKMILDII